MSLKKLVQKWITFMNLPMLTEMEKISYNMEQIRRNQILYLHGGAVPIVSTDVEEGLQYIGRFNDECILPWMQENKKTWAYDKIERFLRIISELLDLPNDMEGMCFLDIGANIGTTSIYVAKKKNIRVIAFEPDEDNFKILRCNCILNGLEENIKCENVALSNKAGQQKFKYDAKNPGASRLIQGEEESEAEITDVEVTTLDKYIQNNNIDIESVKFIWMDTEGHEAKVIEGGLQLLHQKAIPLFMEINQNNYSKEGMLQKYIANMKSIYTHFMDMDVYDGQTLMWIPISDLEKYLSGLEDKNVGQTDFLFIKR